MVYSPLKMPVPFYPPEVKEKAFQLFKERLKLPEIAARLNLPPSTVTRWSSIHRWRVRLTEELLGKADRSPSPSDGKSALELPVAPYTTPISPLSLSASQEKYQIEMQSQALRLPTLMASLSDVGLLASAEKLAKLDGIARKALRLETDKPAVVVNIGLLSSSEPPRRLKSCAVALDLPSTELPTEEENAGATPAATDEPSELPGAEREV